MSTPERISVEATNRCSKGCPFCYNDSRPGGKSRWDPRELVEFCRDCVLGGVKAVSFGGGEPLEYEGIFHVLEHLRGVLFRSIGWDKQVSWCSYTRTRRKLGGLKHADLAAALDGLGLESCGRRGEPIEPRSDHQSTE